MAELAQILDHADRAVARLIQKFRTKPKIQALVNALIAPFQTLEDDLWALYSERWLSTAEGVQLDVLGRIVGQSRAGASDDEYRIRIGARIRANLSSGTAEEVLAVFLALFGSDADLQLIELDGDLAEFALRVHTVLTQEEIDIALEFLRDCKADGVRAILKWQKQPTNESFGFANSGGLGFGDGKFTGAATS